VTFVYANNLTTGTCGKITRLFYFPWLQIETFSPKRCSVSCEDEWSILGSILGSISYCFYIYHSLFQTPNGLKEVYTCSYIYYISFLL